MFLCPNLCASLVDSQAMQCCAFTIVLLFIECVKHKAAVFSVDVAEDIIRCRVICLLIAQMEKCSKLLIIKKEPLGCDVEMIDCVLGMVGQTFKIIKQIFVWQPLLSLGCVVLSTH